MASERTFTASLKELFGTDRRIAVGIGDDAAVVTGHPRCVLACDPVVESVHFAPGAPLRWVGRKAVNRNLADLAAMGARPDYLLASVLLPRRVTAAQRRSLFLGLRDAAGAAGCRVVGGDVAATPGPLTVTVTAAGHLEGRPLCRTGAQAGDAIHVTGPLGGSSLGHHLRFQPPLKEGLWLARQPAVGAAIDVSDGLLLDLQTLLSASGALGAELFAAALPVAAAARRLARRSGRSPLEHALGDGEDHELLFTVRAGARLAARGPLTAVARRPIGRVLPRPGLFLVTDGDRRRLPARGYQHWQ